MVPGLGGQHIDGKPHPQTSLSQLPHPYIPWLPYLEGEVGRGNPETLRIHLKAINPIETT